MRRQPPGHTLQPTAHRALDRLSAENHAIAAMEMFYFGGMTAWEIGAAVGRTPHSVRHDLRVGRAWLRRALAEGR